MPPMIKKALPTWSLLALGLMVAGCGLNAPGLGQSLNSLGAEADARKDLGAGAYGQFKLAPQLPKAEGSRRAVKLTYLMTDDDAHQSPQSAGMLAMMDGLAQQHVHNLVFRDGKEVGDSTLTYLQQADRNAKAIGNPTSALAPGVHEVASNHPKVFSEVLEWSLDQYPAKRRYLQIYTHGGGIFGIGTDTRQMGPDGKALPEAQQRKVMRLPEFGEAMRQALKGRQLDALYFRACLMGSVEALYEVRGLVRYAIASEDVSMSTDNSNLAMTQLFDELAAKDVEPAELSRQMAIAGRGKHPTQVPGHSGYNTIGAYDVGQMDELKTSLNVLARSLSADLKGPGRAAVLAAYDATPAFNEKYAAMRDLWAFSAQLLKASPSASTKQAVDAVRAAQRKATLHAKDAFADAANGLSIMLPPRGGDAEAKKRHLAFLDGAYQQTRFAKDGAWDAFVREALAAK